MFFHNVWFQNLKFEDKILDIFFGGGGPSCVWALAQNVSWIIQELKSFLTPHYPAFSQNSEDFFPVYFS